MRRPADGPKTATTAQTRAKVRHLKEIALKPSQLEAISGDVDLEALNLALKGFASEKIIERVTSADIERTIEGASTFTIGVEDVDYELIRSPFLHHKADTVVDGLWFRFVGAEGAMGGAINLTFEDREVSVHRTYNKPKSAAWGKTTRPRFIRDMIREVKEMKIPFVCPEIGEVKKIGSSSSPNDLAEQRDVNRAPGFSFGNRTKVTVKNVPADEQQLSNISRVLNVGIGRKVRRKLLVCAIMTITVESVARNLLKIVDHDSAGLFQQRPSQGWGSYAEVTTQEHAANKFYDQAIAYDAQHPLAGYGEVCQAVQRSAFPTAYDQWRTEAERTVKLYGVPGGDTSTTGDVEQDSRLKLISTEDGIFLGTSAGSQDDYQFTRGNFSKTSAGKRKVEKEDTWTCSGRLAEEVQWRRFMVSGTFYYMSEHYMWRSRPRAHVSVDDEFHAASPQFSYDLGQKNAQITLTVFADRWEVPPGSVIMLDEDFGSLLEGRWLVTKTARSLFSPILTVTLSKPRPQLPEPKQTSATPFSLVSDKTPKIEKTPGMVSGYVAPLKTDGNLNKSEFSQTDAEGAPDHLGIRHHAGKDWFASSGSAVVAPIDGTIVELKPSPGYSGQVFGGTVKIQQANGMVWVFRHVDPLMAFRVGAEVKQGQKVAAVARWADNPSSSHCHIEFWKTLSGGYEYENMLDPCKVLKGEV